MLLVEECGDRVTRDSVLGHCFHPGDPSVEIVSNERNNILYYVSVHTMCVWGGGGMAGD